MDVLFRQEHGLILLLRRRSITGSLGRRQTGNINIGVMDHLGAYYKMDDRDIRVYIGQPDPLNEASDESSEIVMMRDQSKWFVFVFSVLSYFC